MTKRFISKVDMTYIPKNSLEKELVLYLKQMDRKIIPADKVNDFKKMILDHIKGLEISYPRCSTLDAVFYDDEYNKCYWLDVRCVSFKLYEGRDWE